MFWHIFHLFFHPQKCMFQFKKSILFSVNAEPLFRLQVLKMPKIQKEYSKGKSVIKAKKLYFVLIHSLKFFSCHLHVGICFTFYFLIHLVLSGETAVYFTPFRGRAVISCFDLSLRFSTPASVCWHSHSLQDLQKKDDFISPLVKALLGEAQHCLCSKPSFPSLPPSLWFFSSTAKLPRKPQFPSQTSPGFGPAGNTSMASSAQAVLSCEASGNLHKNSDVLLTFQSTWCVWFRSQLVFPTCGSLQESCSLVLTTQNGLGWKRTLKITQVQPSCQGQGWKIGKAMYAAHLLPPSFSLVIQGHNWNPLDYSFESAFSLGFLAFEALHTQPRAPVSRCCSLKCVNKCRCAEAESYIKR